MNLLLVDDEAGIREGLASFLRIKGHRVVTAASAAAALELIAAESFDVLITDWRIGKDRGGALVLASACPSIVFSGTPEDVRDVPERVLVLRKPVAPRDLVDALERHYSKERTEAGADGSAGAATSAAWLAGLPRDTADRFALALALAGATPEVATFHDDGVHATLSAPLPHGEGAIADLERLGGDFQVRGTADSGLRFTLRVFRDGRADGVSTTIPLGAKWPSARSFAIDCEGADLRRLPDFLASLKRARRRGPGRISFVNVPSAWQLWLEISGKVDDMPKRTKAGPHLPEFLNVLWSRA